jgi:deoxyribonuclease-4
MIGFHVPLIKKSFKKSIEIPHKKCNIKAFQIFISNPRQLKIVQHNEESTKECKEYIKENNLFLVSHATYILNSGSREKWSDKIECALNDLIYAEKIGAIGSVFHVGKHLTHSIEYGINNMFEFICTVIEELEKINSNSIYILETCASQGTELLSNLEDFGKFYHMFTDKQKEHLKICIDTCHVFASGYELKNENDANIFIEIVQKNIGWNNVILIHLNDSKKDVGCCVDRHENLCMGCIGKDDDSGFRTIVKHCYNLKIPLILETPYDDNNMYEIYKRDLDKVNKWIFG